MKNENQNSQSQPAPTVVPRETMNGKPVLYRINTKSVINLDSDQFEDKLLCDGLTFTMGDSCVFGCAFCYVEATPISWLNKKLIDELNISLGLGFYDPAKKYEKKNRKSGKIVTIIPVTAFPGKTLLRFKDVVIRRSKAIEVLKSQLLDARGEPRYKTPGDTRVIFSSTLVDVAANMELVRETAEACCLILKHTNWQIRLLSKSNLLPKLVKLIPTEYYPRLILGVSTGTLDDALARSFEKGTALVSKRISSLNEVRAMGIRTFGMICPSLPQKDYDLFSKDICTAIDVNACEEVWAEVINLRGKSFTDTINALLESGHTNEANELAKVCGPKTIAQWEDYARATFLAHVKHVPKGKLRFLQYVEAETYDWWKAHEKDGAVLLGKYAEDRKDKETASPVQMKSVNTEPSPKDSAEVTTSADQLHLPVAEAVEKPVKSSEVKTQIPFGMTFTIPKNSQLSIATKELESGETFVSISLSKMPEKTLNENGISPLPQPASELTPRQIAAYKAWDTIRRKRAEAQKAG